MVWSFQAVAAMAVAADRTCIHTNGSINSQLSALDVIECCTVCGNCFGGDPLKAMVYWALEGWSGEKISWNQKKDIPLPRGCFRRP
jgi:hypothetical protein